MVAKAKKDEATQTPAAKQTRKMLTPEERIKKLEADLEAARAKAAEKDAKRIDKLKEQRGVAVQKVNEAQAKLTAIDEELQLLGYEVKPDDTFTSTPLDEV